MMIRRHQKYFNRVRAYFYGYVGSWNKLLVIIFFAICSIILVISTISSTGNDYPPTGSRTSQVQPDRREILTRMKGPLKFDDDDFINLIRKEYLVAPPPESVPYNLRHAVSDESHHYKSRFPSWMMIDSILKDLYPSKIRRGFFVEAGALDGEFLSNTLRIEMEQGWTGLLVEPDKDNYKLLKEANRKAWLTPTCLSLHTFPESVVLSKLREVGEEVDWLMRANSFIILNNEVPKLERNPRFLTTYDAAQCLPTHSLLMALNVSHVDFFSLDIELTEEDILSYFPFDQITVDVWAIEHRRNDRRQRVASNTFQNYTLIDMRRLGFDEEVIRYRELLISEFEDQRFIKVMVDRGYYYFDMSCAFVGDYIFVRKESDLFKKLKVPKHQENRTEICKFKEVHATSQLQYFDLKLRDLHHYPQLQYKEL